MKSTIAFARPKFQFNTLALILLFSCLAMSSLYAVDPPGGIIEYPDSLKTRQVLSQQQIQGMLPARGSFNFPAPYNTRAVRLTNASDCGGNDCVKEVGYSYWRNINNHVGQESMLFFLGLDIMKGGAGTTLFEYNKNTEVLRNLGPLFPTTHALGWASGESWYFSGTKPTSLYVTDIAKLSRYDVITGAIQLVFDLHAYMGTSYYLWQTHSSDDDRVHSATVRSNGGEMLGCLAFREDIRQTYYYPKKGDYDECQIDRSGRWLVIKEDVDHRDGEDNRIIDLQTGTERVLTDRDGAGGHSDLGHGTMVATNNWGSQANEVKLWDFAAPTLNGKTVYHNQDWNAGAPDHISYTNANPNTPAANQFACGSTAHRWNAPHTNEIVCFTLNGDRKTLVVAPVMTNLNAGGGRSDYNNSPKGNLDITGQYFIWTSNTGGSRLDAFLVKVPSQLLTGSVPNSTPAPTFSPSSSDFTAPNISSMSVGNITASSANLTWFTDEPAENLVAYGTIFPHGGASPHMVQLSTSHNVTLTGLQASTTYSYNAYVRDAAGNIGLIFGTFRTAASATSTLQAVNWTQLTHASVTGSTLRKLSECDGCADAGAVSAQQLVGGSGYLKFTAINENRLRYIGLTSRTGVTSAADLDYGIRLQGNIAEVRENDNYRYDFTFNSGDVIQITLAGGNVSYSRNGSVFYTSTRSPDAGLRAGAALYSNWSSASDVMIFANAQ